MGMVPFLLLAAAEKRRREQAAAGARRRLAEQAKKKQSSHSFAYVPRNSKSYIDCLLKELAYDNPELFEFFKKFDLAVDSAVEEKCATSTKGITECLDLAKKYVEQIEKIKEKMKKAGLTDEGLEFDECVSFYAPEAEERDLEFTRTGISYLGVHISKEMAENPKDKTFEDAYERMQEELQAVNEKEKQVLAELAEHERKLSHTIRSSKKEELQENIRKCKEKLESFQKIREKADLAKRRRNFFANLTPEQRSLMVEYYEASEEVKELAQLVRTHTSQRENAKRSRTDKDVILRAFEILGERENLSKEDIEKIFDQLDKVAIKRHRGEYDMRSWSTAYDAPVERYKSTIVGFVKHIYEADPKFVERNAWEVSDSDLDEPEY